MHANDVVLLNNFLNRWKDAAPQGLADDRLFELFALEQVLKDWELSTDELLDGLTGGGNDGGIDGFVVLLNGEAVNEDTDYGIAKRNPELAVCLVQASRTESFEEFKLNAVLQTVRDLFDLSKTPDQLNYSYSQALVRQATIFREAMKGPGGPASKSPIEIRNGHQGRNSGHTPQHAGPRQRASKAHG